MKNLKGKSYEHGVRAYKNELPAKPSLDQNFLNDILINVTDEEIYITYINEWLEGWHSSTYQSI